MARGSVRALALLAPLTVAACGGATRAVTRAVPTIAVVTPRPALREVPYDQPFAFVADTALFTGVTVRDTSPLDRAGLQRIRESIGIPLATLGWFEVEPSRARFRIAVLHTDGPAWQWTERELVPSTARAHTCWQLVSTGSLYRGFAIERLSDGAIFSRLHRGGAFDGKTAEEFLSAELMKLVLLLNPGPDVPAVSQPPAGALFCSEVGTDGFTPAPQPRRPPAASAPPIPTAPPTTPPTRRPCCG